MTVFVCLTDMCVFIWINFLTPTLFCKVNVFALMPFIWGWCENRAKTTLMEISMVHDELTKILRFFNGLLPEEFYSFPQDKIL